VTKEADWRVARAYISLVEDDRDIPEDKEDEKYLKSPGKQTLEAKAVGSLFGQWRVGSCAG
jgi:hypothetical protein